MERWCGKVAVVTGASAGIGAAISIDLVKSGIRVVGLARRPERVEALKQELPETVAGELHSFKCDVTKECDIKAAFQWVENKFGGIDILVNNAGIAYKMNLIDADNTSKIKSVIDTNIMGPALCTREAFQLMKKNNIDGHVIIINSILGHGVPFFTSGRSFNIYPCTKHAITAMTEVLRQEFQLLKTKIKITSISPGATETEIFDAESLVKLKEIGFPFLKSEDISDAVHYVLSTPAHVQVHELTIKPVGEKI